MLVNFINKNKFTLKIVFLVAVSFAVLLAQQEFPPPNSDFKYQNINNIKMVYGNTGFPDPGYVGVGGFSHALNYPKGSNNTFLAWSGFWLGGIVAGDTLASISGAYDSQGSPGGAVHEFFPDFNPADTVYSLSMFEKQNPEVTPNLVTDIFAEDRTLHPDYYPLSHQDLISQYYDYKVTSQTPEAPEILRIDGQTKLMYARIISRCFAWDNEWYSNVVVYDYFIINEHDSAWKDVHFAIYSDPHSGDFGKGVTINDDISYWDEKGQFLVQGDHPGTGGDDMDDGALIGWDVLGFSRPGQTEKIKGLNTRFWSWEHGPNDPHTNADYYRELSKNEIDRTYDEETYGSMRGLIGKGPVEEIAPGDTLRVTVALAGGKGIKQLRESMKSARSLYKGGFQVPKSPNPPKFTVEPQNHAITIDWHWKDSYEGYPPTESRDESRNDNIVYDFDGFKVYRSVAGPEGPWNLIAQYDSINGHGYDSGLKYEFTDTGLKNGLKYWYAVTSYDIRDDSAGVGPLESPITYQVESTMPGPNPEFQENEKVYAVPNPYRADLDYSQNPAWEYPTQELRDEWYEIDRRIAFMNLPAKCTIKIFTLNGLLVREMKHDRATKGHNIASWNLLNKNNHTVGSGIYYFVVEGTGESSDFKQVGKFVIVK
jgi:hypothetical protein